MKRSHFIKDCAMTCVAVMIPGFLLSGCRSLYFQAEVVNNKILVPLSAFEGKGSKPPTTALIALHDHLPYPVLVVHSDTYRAFEMKCTHQGAELQFTGSRLSCPAHGSEFGLKGEVLNGPAAASLKEFQVNIDHQHIQIQLS
jgi:Rieske Fe-S protein